MKQSKPSNWGECYYNLYESIFGEPILNTRHSHDEYDYTIQILVYENIFDGCRAFCSLGLTHYTQQVCGVGEVLIIVDDGWEDVPSILATTLFLMVDHKRHLHRGSATDGLAQIRPLFAERYSKSAVYLTDPFGLPDRFSEVKFQGKIGRVYLGFFISSDECAYYSQHGADEFESLLEMKQVDIFNLSRRSCL